MKTMHLFAGAGGGLLADLILGHEPVVAVEWEPYACQVLRERAEEGWFPELRVWEGDVRLFDPSEYAGSVDCIHAGFPCQDISVAGKQAGVGEETRSGLYREVLRIAGVVRPRYLFLENVSAIVSNGFATVIADFTKIGYDTEWLCLRASDCGAPHHRDRWWCLAHSKSDGDWGGQRNIPEKDGRQIGQMRVESIGSSSESKNVAYTNNDDRRRRHRSKSLGREARMESGCCCEDVAHANCTQRKGACRVKEQSQVRPCDSCKDVSNSECIGLPGSREPINAVNTAQGRDWKATELEHGGFRDFWSIEPNVGRVANGVAHRVHRLKALGNGQVPLQAAVAWKLLGGP